MCVTYVELLVERSAAASGLVIYETIPVINHTLLCVCLGRLGARAVWRGAMVRKRRRRSRDRGGVRRAQTKLPTNLVSVRCSMNSTDSLNVTFDHAKSYEAAWAAAQDWLRRNSSPLPHKDWQVVSCVGLLPSISFATVEHDIWGDPVNGASATDDAYFEPYLSGVDGIDSPCGFRVHGPRNGRICITRHQEVFG